MAYDLRQQHVYRETGGYSIAHEFGQSTHVMSNEIRHRRDIYSDSLKDIADGQYEPEKAGNEIDTMGRYVSGSKEDDRYVVAG